TRCEFDGFDSPQVSRIAKPLLQHLSIAADHHDHIVEVVRYAAGQLAQGLHLLRLRKLLLGAPQSRLRLTALGDVAGDFCKPDELAMLVTDGVDYDAREIERAVLTDTPAVGGVSP